MVTKYANTITHASTCWNSNGVWQIPYKAWDDRDNLKGNEGYAICNRTLGSIATASGTYNTPAPLDLTDFQFDIPEGATIEKIVVHYSHRKISMSSSAAYPKINAPTITLLNTGKTATGVAPPTSYTANTVEFTGVTRTQINSSNFGVRFSYPKNTSTNTGRLALGNVYIEVVYTAPQITLKGTIPSKVVVGQSLTLHAEVTKSNSVEYDPSIRIHIPEELKYLRLTSGVGTITPNSMTQITWNSTMKAAPTTNTADIAFQALTKGNYTIQFEDTVSGKTYNLAYTVVEVTDSISSGIAEGYLEGESNSYNIVVKTNEAGVTNRTVKVLLPADTTLENWTYLQSEFDATRQSHSEGSLFVFSADISNGSRTIPLKPIFNVAGYYTEKIWIGTKQYLSTNFYVRSNSLGRLGFARVRVPDEVTSGMGNNQKYVFSSVVRNNPLNIEYIGTDNARNLRIGVFNADESNLNNETDFLSLVTWSRGMAGTNWTEKSVSFKYYENYPLYLVFSQEYEGDMNYNVSQFEFTEPLLVESQFASEVISNKPYLYPPTALLANDDYAVAELEQGEETTPVIVYEWAHGGVFDLTNLRLQGIICSMDYVTSYNIELQVELAINNGEKTGYRNITLKKGSGTIDLGGSYDLFGLKPSDFRSSISTLEIRISVLNPYNNKTTVEINNVQLTLNYMQVADLGNGFIVDGERSEDYGIYLHELDHDWGAEHDVSEYSVPGTDKVIYARMNIDKKEIEITFSIDACDVEETVPLLDRILAKFANKREPLSNKPYPKSIIFDHMPDRRFWYILEKPFDGELNADMYEGSIKLTIPDGTAEAIHETVTGSTGQTNGIYKVMPVIELLNNADGEISLKENIQGLTFTVLNDKIKSGASIILDNANRSVLCYNPGSKTAIDLTHSVAYNSDYFFLQGAYQFTSETSTIVSVSYHERLS